MWARALNALLSLVYCAVLWRTRRVRMPAYKAWLGFLVAYGVLLAYLTPVPGRPGWTLTGWLGAVQILLQFAAVYDAVRRCAGVLTARHARAAIEYCWGFGVLLASVFLYSRPVPHPLVDPRHWYTRTGAAVIELGMLATAVLYLLVTLAGPAALPVMTHAAIMLAWVAVTAWGHGQTSYAAGIIVRVVHLACGVAWIRAAPLAVVRSAPR